ncbi:hypothetical protein KIW84_023288 [Lathyrus oleraceus]|uniref:Uncharacterized protein n=1 Tax=Pisum sativum TaxID=3888 RepID=A0A9D5B7S6_PEA|nr:hypothetical protein KIW84_023288 [Pisum sativum]
MGRPDEAQPELEVTDNKICQVTTANQARKWPLKGKFVASKLSVKYAMLHKISYGVQEHVHAGLFQNVIHKVMASDMTRFDQLNLIEEKRLIAMCHGQLYQQRMKTAFDRKVRPRMFREGDLVLKKILSFKPDSRGKWTSKYEGPYVVKRAFSGGALILTTIDGEELTRPVNTDAVNKYFA